MNTFSFFIPGLHRRAYYASGARNRIAIVTGVKSKFVHSKIEKKQLIYSLNVKRNLFSFLHDHFSYRLYCSYLHDYHNVGEDLCWLVLLRPSFQGDDHFSLLPFPGKATFRQLPLQVQKYIDGLQLFSVAKNGF